MIEPLQDLVDAQELRDALPYGLAAVALAVALGPVWTRWRGTTAPVAGVLAAGACLLGLDRTELLPGDLALGIGLVGAAGLLTALPVVPRVAGAALAVPGAWVVASRSELVDVTWVRGLVGVGIVVGGLLVADFDDRFREHAFAPVLVAVSVLGVYVTVPDTEQALVLVAAAVPLVLASWPWPLASLGPAGAYAVTGLLLWTAAAGGVGRRASIVGGAACLGLLVVEPVTRALLRGRRSPLDAVVDHLPSWAASVAVAALHLVLVLVAARVAGLRDEVVAAVAIAGAAFVGAVVAGLVAGRTVRAPETSPARGGSGL